MTRGRASAPLCPPPLPRRQLPLGDERARPRAHHHHHASTPLVHLLARGTHPAPYTLSNPSYYLLGFFLGVDSLLEIRRLISFTK
ncbi:Aspartic proteinase A1 [Zea mays]|uniref:Aspartic proteinase A1 n=1 Tax=Zea mays TaxID=4577 RepID=A0A1D6H1S1_MAIZE|nr:Aspartic proteinase A1 [Zea mays]AQK45613.1 Aspartic proteinase A1 [Zea mays]AQK68832.1 Aspartic proteinase A1 [Zea mays]AQK68835.1 Aspartic proteinase A1 [Zea mays]AQL00971.1 Aspartic proteinase A1 [Zea mays]